MSSSYDLTKFSDGYLDDSHDINSIMNQIYNQNISQTQGLWYQQSVDERFVAGDQNIWGEVYPQIPYHKRKGFSFNKIRRIVNMISGYQRRNRKALNVIPIGQEDESTSNQHSKTLFWVYKNTDTANVFSDAFEGSLMTGLNLLEAWVDYSADPFSGDIKLNNLGYNSFLLDPYFKKKDLSDCNYVWVRKFMSKQQLIAIMPERKNEIMNMRSSNNPDGYFNFLPQTYNSPMKDLLPYDEFWYLEARKQTIIVDPRNEEVIEWHGNNENLRLFLMRFPQYKKAVIEKPTCKLATRVNNKVFYDGKNPYGIDRYPFVPVVAYHYPELPTYESRVQGVVRPLRDPQFLLNRRQQILLDVLESQVNSGLKVMEGSLVDDKDAFKSGQGQVLFVKKNAPLGLQSVEKIMPGDVSPAFTQVIDQMNQNMVDIAGINEELLGSADDDKAGILSMLRQGAGLTTLQGLFDNADTALLNLGKLYAELYVNNFTAAKVRRIINEEPTEQFFNKAFQKFDCEVVEGSDTPTQRMTAFKQKLYLREIGIPIPTEDLLADATFQNKNETIQKIIQQEQQQAQMQQQQMQLQMMELQSRANLANARADADRGLFVERTSRVEENKSAAIERRAKSISELESATLDKIKALKELNGVDLTHLQQLVDIINSMKEQEASQAEVEMPKEAKSSSEGA